MKKTKQEAEATKQAILQSAMDLFYQKGYSKTTFEEVSSRIGLTKGAVYWYFKNKPELVAAIINMYVDNKTIYLEQKVGRLKHLQDIETYFLAAADYILSDKNAMKVAFFLSLQMEWSESIITKVLEGLSQNTKLCFEQVKNALILMQKSGEIRNDVDPELIASMIFNLWTGNLEAYLSKRSSFDLKYMMQKSFDLLFNGLILKKE